MKESREITPLRTILRNCLNHIDNLETNRSVCDNYDKEFQNLKQFSESLKTQKEYLCTEGEKEVNRKKNRYKDILPFNISRVILNEYAGVPGSDYINANFIKGASGSPAYIASQGPLPNTVNDFWRMVVECEVQVIVMACNAQESGKHKCENYWVEKEGEEKRFGMVQICLVKASIVCPDFLVRTMRLKYTNEKDVMEERTVCQFHYSAWPDHGVPPLVRPLLDMVRLVRDTQASETLPVLVHCSAGCGRTGTICAIDFVWGLLRAGKLTEEFSLFNLVKDMRKQRVAMVQTKEQYILVHQAVRELFKEQLRVIESHPYENIDFNGVPLIKNYEEPFYETINVQSENNCDEKQDNSEMKEKNEDLESRMCKNDAAPPLPRKKRPNVLFSKQEKEAENLTEKNRLSFAEKEKMDSQIGILGKPSIVKLRALFERSPNNKERSGLKDRGSQTVSRSHSLGAIRKPINSEVFETIFEKNKLLASPCVTSSVDVKLKHSKSFTKSVPLIKRSKSLKAFSEPPTLYLVSNDIEWPTNKNQLQCQEAYTNDNNQNNANSECIIVRRTQLFKEDPKRRRSLESLMGDSPPTITWPTVVMESEKESRNFTCKHKSEVTTQFNHTVQKNKTTDLIKQKLQKLNLETDRRISNYASSIGVRERRNSFRQAVSKNDFQYVYQDLNEPQPFRSKRVFGNDFGRSPFSCKSVKHIEEASVNCKSTNAVNPEREGIVDTKLSVSKGKIVTDGLKYKLLASYSNLEDYGPQSQKFTTRQTSHQSLGMSSNNPNQVVDFRMHKATTTPKNSRVYSDVDKNIESKNLFLKKLNSEILSEKERERKLEYSLQLGENQYRSDESSDKAVVSGISSNSVPNESKKTSLKSNIITSGVPSADTSFDEPDGLNKSSRSVDLEADKILQSSSWHNSCIQGHQLYVKPQKSPKPFEIFKSYSTASVPQNLFGRTSNTHIGLQYPSSSGESSNSFRRDELSVQNILHKESFLPVSSVKNIPKISKMFHPNQETEVSVGSYRRNPTSDLYVTVNPDFENLDRKVMLSSKIITDKVSNNIYNGATFWPLTTSSRSSGEESVLEQNPVKSESSKFSGKYENEILLKGERQVFKKIEPSKDGGKVNTSEFGKNSFDLPNGFTKLKRFEEKKGVYTKEYFNYGSSNMPLSMSKYAKDDFVLDEPSVPPRVKRHASVTIPRSNLSSYDHHTQWTTHESNARSSRTSIKQPDKNAWSGSHDVDLDAVAASILQEKKESAVLNNGVWSSKNHVKSANPKSKKKQHYF